ncbi:MAG: hypothetical protein ABIA04_10385 [Pseudomonadota bacterium]
MYNYKIFNLNIESQFQIRALNSVKEAFTNPNLKIIIAKTPDNLSRPIRKKNVCCQMAENEFLFFNEKLGLRYYVKDGKEIIIDQDFMKDEDKLSLFLLGSVMGATLYMKNYLPMHASTILTGKGAVMFIGNSGVGKSTLAYAFYKRGYRVITDDIAPIKMENKKLNLFASYPMMKLWEDSIKLNQETGDFIQVRDSLNKYYVSYEQLDQGKAIPIYKMYHVRTHNDEKILTIEKTLGKARLKIIKANSYRKSYIQGLNKQSTFFKIAVELAKLPMTTITRPQRTEDFKHYIDVIEKDILK